jgi:SAM-dependent methyltransferase
MCRKIQNPWIYWGVLKTFLHRVVAVPSVYEQVQVFFGANKKRAIVQKYLPTLGPQASILDLGGGTGFYRNIWPSTFQYICLDNDWVKLQGFRDNFPQDSALWADASRIPLRDNSIDVIFCNSMSHHISMDTLEQLLAESARILKSSGKIFFLDAIRLPNPVNRLLWKLDRGEHPHTLEDLKEALQKNFAIDSMDQFDNFYNYVFFIATKKAAA